MATSSRCGCPHVTDELGQVGSHAGDISDLQEA